MKDVTVRRLERVFSYGIPFFLFVTAIIWLLVMETITSIAEEGNAIKLADSFVEMLIAIVLCYLPLALAWVSDEMSMYFYRRIQWTEEEIRLAELRRFGDLNAP